MAQVTNFFAGANSGSGFQNLFAEMMDLETTYDFMILKGGPGVGKNTFMKEIGRAMEQAGTPVEYLWCSGDPDSLDGLVLPELHCGIADGTSPHVLDPRYPAAVDRYVDLGRFYDLTAVKRDAEAIRQATRTYKAAYVQAYRSLKAAREVELEAIDAVQKTADRERIAKRMQGILQRELRKKGCQQGKCVRRFLGSLTHRGGVWCFDSVDTLCPRVYEYSDRWELAGDGFAMLQSAAAENGWDSIACVAPEDPNRVEHLLIPELGVAFVTSRPGMEYGRRPYRHIRLDAMTNPEKKSELRFSTKMVDALRKDGIRGLKEAKEAHDRLEKIYNPCVDFEGVRALAAVETGRLLSWLDR